MKTNKLTYMKIEKERTNLKVINKAQYHCYNLPKETNREIAW